MYIKEIHTAIFTTVFLVSVIFDSKVFMIYFIYIVNFKPL